MSELKKLTRLGSDTKKIAALLQAKAPKGHMLAYISPKEASLLKARGGSGKPHEDTGILSFENEFDMGPTMEQPPLDSSFAQYEVPAAPIQDFSVAPYQDFGPLDFSQAGTFAAAPQDFGAAAPLPTLPVKLTTPKFKGYVTPPVK